MNAIWSQIGVPIGLVLANGSMILAASLTTEAEFEAWGWRISFLLSILLCVVGLFLRFAVGETHVFREEIGEADKPKLPILEVLKNYPKQVLLAMGARIGVVVAFYVFVISISTYVVAHVGLPEQYALYAVVIGALIQIFALPFFGRLSDQVGRKPVYVGGALLTVIWMFIYFLLLDSGSFPVIAGATVIALVLHPSMFGPQAAFISEMFPAEVRYTGASLGFQIAGVLGSGIAPMIAMGLLDSLGGSMALSVYAVATLLITIVATTFARETSGKRQRDRTLPGGDPNVMVSTPPRIRTLPSHDSKEISHDS